VLVVAGTQIHDGLVLDAAVGQDVPEFGTVLAKHFAHEEAAVTVIGSAAATEQREPVSPCPVQQSIDGDTKRGRLGHRPVKRVPFKVVVVVPFRSTTE